MQVRLVALVPVLGLALAGCSGVEPQAQPSSLPPVSASPSPSPPPAAPEVPDGARAASAAGAAAFASYYYEQVGVSYSTLDSRPLLPLMAPGCLACKQLVALLEGEKRAGRRYSGGGSDIKAAQAVLDPSGDTADVALTYIAAPLVRLQPPATTKDVASPVAVQVSLQRHGDSWWVTRVTPVQP